MASPQPLSHVRDEQTSTASQNRDSNMVRASVLDAALQLGFGGPNSTVANWIFNNPLEEEEESEDVSISLFVLLQHYLFMTVLRHRYPNCPRPQRRRRSRTRTVMHIRTHR